LGDWGRGHYDRELFPSVQEYGVEAGLLVAGGRSVIYKGQRL